MRPVGSKNKTYTSPQGYEYGCSKDDLLYIPRSKEEALKMFIELTKPAMSDYLARMDDNRARFLKGMLYNQLVNKLTNYHGKTKDLPNR